MWKTRTKLEPFHPMVLYIFGNYAMTNRIVSVCIFGKYAMTNRIVSVRSLSSKKATERIAVNYEYETVGRM
jgi:hypothetical protein